MSLNWKKMPQFLGFNFYDLANNKFNGNNNNLISLKINNNIIKSDTNIIILGKEDIKQLLSIRDQNQFNQNQNKIINRNDDSFKRTHNLDTNSSDNNVLIEEILQNEDQVLDSKEKQCKESVVETKESTNYNSFQSNLKTNNGSDYQSINNNDFPLSLFCGKNQNYDNKEDHRFDFNSNNSESKPIVSQLSYNSCFNNKIKSEPIERSLKQNNQMLSDMRSKRMGTPYPSVKFENMSTSKYINNNSERLNNSCIGSESMKGSKPITTPNYNFNDIFSALQSTQNKFATTSQCIKREPNFCFPSNSCETTQMNRESQLKPILVKREYSETPDSIKLLKRPLSSTNTENSHKKFKTSFLFDKQLNSFENMRKNKNFNEIKPNICGNNVESQHLSPAMNVIPSNMTAVVTPNVNTISNNAFIANKWLNRGFCKKSTTLTPSNGYIIGKSSQLRDILPQQTMQTTKPKSNQFNQINASNSQVRNDSKFFHLYSSTYPQQ